MSKRTYYDITNLLNTDAEYMMLLGQRANGKSYQAKLTCLTEAFKGYKFVYLRRWVADLKTKTVEDYFGDMPIEKITKKKYNSIYALRGYIYFAHRGEDGTIDDKLEIGRYCALNEYERYKSQVFKGYKYIDYEEFITDKLYLDEEPRLLQQFVSTVARLDRIQVFLIGNTLSRVCPYFNEWALEGVLKQKQGTIELYHYKSGTNTITIAVEYCANTNNENKMFFGTASKQIISGEWDVLEYPRLPKRQWEYEKIYEILVIYQAFKFVVELLVEPVNGGILLYVYPSTKDRKIYRIIQDEFSDLPNISSKLDRNKRPEEMIINCIKMNKICYSDNLTGSDFNKCLENMKIC